MTTLLIANSPYSKNMHAPIIFYIIIYEGERLTESGGDGEEAACEKRERRLRSQGGGAAHASENWIPDPTLLPSVLSGCWSATDDGGSAPITARITNSHSLDSDVRSTPIFCARRRLRHRQCCSRFDWLKSVIVLLWNTEEKNIGIFLYPFDRFWRLF